MVSLRGLTGSFAVLAILLVALGADAAGAAPKPVPGETAALLGVKRGVASGQLDRATASAARAEIARAVHLIRVLPSARRRPVEVALEEIATLPVRLTTPRAIALVGQLRANDDWFASHSAPRSGTDITGSDGIVYRYFTNLCFEFHPLANVGALNGHVAAKNAAATQQLADALVARGVSRNGGGVGWEYYFRFGGGRPPWISGMVQAVAAQAFARAAALVPAESTAYLQEAGAAYRAIPGKLLTQLAAGPWIRLYSFSKLAVLNAQLQSILSLQSYAANTNDTSAATLAGQMEQAAATMVSQFDTGYWSNYSLAGNSAPFSYHEYVVQLLRKLAPADPRFAIEAARFALYLEQPPAFKLATAPVGALRFWLSKPAWVTVATAAGGTEQLSLGGGWHTLSWSPKRPGIYPVAVTAVGPAGKRASFQALPLVRVKTGRTAQGRQTAGPGSASMTPPAFAVGAGIDSASQAAQAGSIGLRLVRMTVPWQPGQTSPDPAVVSSLQSLPTGSALVLELNAATLPTDAADRAQLSQYAASLAQQVPALRDLVLTPAPSLALAPAYADTLAAIRAAVQPVRSDVAVGLVFDGTVAEPRSTVLALAKELAADSSRADVAVFRPAPLPGRGVWDATAVGALSKALGQSLKPAPPILLDGIATPTTVPASELAAYTGGPPPTTGAIPAADQAAGYTEAIDSASCSANVIGLLFDRLVDAGAQPEPPTGLYYAGGDPKPAATAVQKEITAVGRGGVVCPGAAATVTPTTLTFPAQLSGSSAASIDLACNRDCLYLVTLDRADGRPVVASRGTLAGRAAAQTITLPGTKLSPGSYHVDVRLVSRVNPGTVTLRTSPALTAG